MSNILIMLQDEVIFLFAESSCQCHQFTEHLPFLIFLNIKMFVTMKKKNSPLLLCCLAIIHHQNPVLTFRAY